MLGSVMDGRTSLPAVQTELTLWVLTTAQRMELTQDFAIGRNVQWSQTCAEGAEVSVDSVMNVAGARVYDQLKCLRVVSHVPEGEC